MAFRIMASTAALMCALLVGREGGAVIGFAVSGLAASIWVLPMLLNWWSKQNIHYREADAHFQTGNWDQAEKWYQAIADVAKQTGVKADMLSKVAVCQARQKKYEEALKTVEQAFPIAKNPDVRARLLSAKADAQLGLGDGTTAALTKREALNIVTSASKDKKAVAESLLELGKTLIASDPKQAQETLTKALEEYKLAYGENSAEMAKPLQALAALNRHTENFAAAIPYLQQAAKLIEEHLTTDAPEFMAVTEQLAEAHDLTGDYDKAVEYFEKAVSLHERHVGKSTPEFITALMYLAAHYCAEGEYAKAMEYARNAHGQMGISRDPRLDEGLELLAIIYERSGRVDEAAAFRSRKAAVA